ncbi:MAG: SurA N-terminal domain-containing protein [Pseudomonadota bacterium]
MLMDIREKIRGWIAYVIVGLISIPFVLWGVGEYIGGGSDATVAEVDGEEISARELDRAYAERRAQMVAQSEGQLTAEMFEQMGVKRQVLDELINERLLVNFVREQGYVIPDEVVASVVRGISAFHRDGQFDRETYERRVAQQGMTVEQFENDIRRDQLFGTLDRALVGSAFVTEPEVRQMVALRDQTREVGLLRVDRQAVSDALPEPEEADLRAYYDEHAQTFERPEQVRLAYLELTPEKLAATQEVSDAALQSAYEDFRSREGREEVRRVRHILIELPEDADAAEVDAARKTLEQAREAILSGEAGFADKAAELSEDSSSRDDGGDLGQVRDGDIAEAFDRAVASLDEGETSEPVRTPFGMHLIKVYDVEPASVPPLEAVRDQLVADLRRDAAERAYYDAAEELASVSYEQPDSLLPAAEAVGLSVQHSDWLSRGQGEGIGEHAAVREAAFDEGVLGEGFNSQLVELGSNHAVVVRVEEHREAQPRPFEEVEADVREHWLRDAVETALEDKATTIRAALGEGREPAEIASPDPAVSWIETARYQRGQSGETLPPEALRTAFGMTPPREGESSVEVTSLAGGDRGVVVLSDVEAGEPAEIDAETRNSMARQLESDQVGRLIAAFIDSLRAEADVTVNEKAID